MARISESCRSMLFVVLAISDWPVCLFPFLFHVCVNPGPERSHSGFQAVGSAICRYKKTITIRPSIS
jgi:hypothetical protein